MSDEKFIALDKIYVPADRLRPMDDGRSLVIAASVKVRGLIHPIVVRPTPNGAASYTLVAGARRLRAHQLLGLEEIEAKVRKGDAKEARAVEVEENLFRDDLNALQRAYFVREFKSLWEQEHGELKPGNPLLGNPADIAELSETPRFYTEAVERIGLSERSIRDCCRIADDLSSTLRQRFEGTEAADNQSLLLRLSKMPPADQAKLVKAIDICAGDLDQALATIEPAAAKPSKDDKTYSTLLSTWGRTNQRVRARFVDALKPDEQRDLFEILKTRLGE